MADVMITVAARNKMLRARAGEIHLPKIAGFAFGDGGVNGSGVVIPPAEDDTGLKNELYRKEIDSYEFLSDTKCRYYCTLEDYELVDAKINELGLYDADGDIIAIKSFKTKGKDDDLQMTFQVDDIF